VGIDAPDLLAGRASAPALAAAARVIGERAGEHLERARRVRHSRAALPALLPAVLAAGHLAMLRRVGWNPLDRRVSCLRTRPWALLWAQVRGKV
jgi:phytoene synthase